MTAILAVPSIRAAREDDAHRRGRFGGHGAGFANQLITRAWCHKTGTRENRRCYRHCGSARWSVRPGHEPDHHFQQPGQLYPPPASATARSSRTCCTRSGASRAAVDPGRELPPGPLLRVPVLSVVGTRRSSPGQPADHRAAAGHGGQRARLLPGPCCRTAPCPCHPRRRFHLNSEGNRHLQRLRPGASDRGAQRTQTFTVGVTAPSR